MHPKDIPLLQTIPPELLHQASLTRTYNAGSIIFNQGDPTTGLWIILEGSTAIERIGADGVVYTTGVWLPGDIIGVAGLWDGSGYPASARALNTPTIALWMSRSRVLELHQTLPAFGLAISQMLASRLRYIQETVADTRGRPVALQIATILMTLARRGGPTIALTHEDLAHMIGIKRETVSRTLREFSQRAWLHVRYGHITIRDIQALRAYVDRGGEGQ